MLNTLTTLTHTMERHTMFKNVMFFLYSKSKISGLTIDSWKCQKYAHKTPIISHYSCDASTFGPRMGMTIEMVVKSLNDYFDDSYDDSHDSDDSDDIAVDYSDEEDVPTITNHIHIPKCVYYREVKPVPQLSPALAWLQPDTYVPDVYLPRRNLTHSQIHKVYDILTVQKDITDKDSLFEAFDESLTHALSTLADSYDVYGVSAPCFTRFPRTGECSLNIPYLMPGVNVKVAPYNCPSDADAYFLYKDILEVQTYIRGHDLPSDVFPLLTTLIVIIPPEVLHENRPGFLKHSVKAFGYNIANWAKNTDWCVMGKQNDMVIVNMFVLMKISSSGTITASLDFT